jgi:hypothetical protein
MSALGELLRAIPWEAARPQSWRAANGEDARTAQDRSANDRNANDRAASDEPASPQVVDFAARCAIPSAASIRDEQIHSLVQKIFFRQTGLLRNVCFSPVEPSSQAAPLCLEVATALVPEGRYNVGLFDASADPVPLEEQLHVPEPFHAKSTWPLSPRLWLVPRQSWWPANGLQSFSSQNLDHLRDLMAGFDFCILYGAPVSWLAVRIAGLCDGLVLILTAHKTRRLAASQIKDQLANAHVPLLGTVLADRRLPVPEALYRKL